MDLIQPFLDAKSRRLQELDDLRNMGRKIVGFFCLHTPPELVEAAGGIPLRLCQMGDAQSLRYGEGHAHSCVCPLIKSCLGFRETRNPWFAGIDAIIGCSVCDQMRNMADVWRLRFKVPTFVFFYPRRLDNSGSKQVLQLEFDWLLSELSVLTGMPVTEAGLRQTIIRYNKIRHYLRILHEMRALPKPIISGTEWFSIVHASFVLDSRKYEQMLRELLQKIQERMPCAAKPIRIMLVGSVLAADDMKIPQIVEATGRGLVVTDALCTGTRVIIPQIAVEGNLRRNIYEAHQKKVPCIHARPNHRLYEYVDEEIRKLAVDGVIFHSLKFCDGWGSEWVRMQRFLSSRNIASLVIDTDYTVSDTGQVTTRIEAFLEMLRERRDGEVNGV